MTTETLNRFSQARDGHIPHAFSLAADVLGVQIVMVNVFLVGDPLDAETGWVLVDGGLKFSASRIIRAAEERFGPGARPKAIILTHGHFDHVGALDELLRRWDVPIYAHRMELPYLTGESSYPPPDPTVGGGVMARASMLYPNGPTNFGARVQPLPADGSIPFMPHWRWIFTPGHAPGHVSLFRDYDRVLIAGDAFVTTKQESLLSVMTQRKQIHGPPMYFTPDWTAARDSVRKLATLMPSCAATGHGLPMCNPRLMRELEHLARNFDQLAIPPRGRYVNRPALADESGVLAVPPPVSDPFPTIVVISAIAAGIALIALRRDRKK